MLRTKQLVYSSLITAIALAACSLPPPAAPASSAAAAAPPAPTAAPWVFPDGSRIAGVDVGGLSLDAATLLLAERLDRWQAPLPLTADPQTVDTNTPALLPASVGLRPDVEHLIARARRQAQRGQIVDLRWKPQVELARLYTALQTLAPAFERPATREVVKDSAALTTTYTFRAQPRRSLDVGATTELLTHLLADRPEPLPATVVLAPSRPRRPPLTELQTVLEEQLNTWQGVAAVYVYDLQTDEAIGVNDNTVFSGASVMKVPIMLYAYARLGVLDDWQHALMEKMIVHSDNGAANDLLAVAADKGVADALAGVADMSNWLAGLGFQYTYQLLPYGSEAWLAEQVAARNTRPIQEGEPPYTQPDPYLRTTPREMGQLFVMLAECSAGKGLLIEKHGDTLDAALCDEMIGWLAQPRDLHWMTAGVPPGTRVAHKSGWLDDMQSDTGIVYSPHGRYVAAIYVWRKDHVADEPSPFLAAVSHTIYSFFNPQTKEQ